MIEPALLQQLWTENIDRLLLVARSIGEPAEDAVQEAFVRLAVQHDLPDDPVAWLVRVMRNQLLAWHREGTRRRRREQVRAAEAPWFTEKASRSDEVDWSEVAEQLRRLEDEPRQVIVMHLWGGLTFQQIAEILGSSRSTIHRIYQKALAELRARCEAPLAEKR
jgi:RNA polymerase sigma factor (sigma-70 family)